MLNVVDSSLDVTRKFPVAPASDEDATVYALVVSLWLFPVSLTIHHGRRHTFCWLGN